jgi:Na+/melibiose symporter-like transporter
MNVIGLNKFMFAMITLIGQLCSCVGVVIYGAFLRKIEVRWVLFWNCVFNVVGSFLNYAFAMRWNLAWGMSDMSFIIFSDVVTGALNTAFQLLPLLSMFAKIIPKNIEGTMFAFLTGAWNLD